MRARNDGLGPSRSVDDDAPKGGRRVERCQATAKLVVAQHCVLDHDRTPSRDVRQFGGIAPRFGDGHAADAPALVLETYRLGGHTTLEDAGKNHPKQVRREECGQKP